MSSGTQRDQGLEKNNVAIDSRVNTLYMTTKYCVEMTYHTVVDHQVRSVVLVIVGLKKEEMQVRHAAIVKTMTQR